MAKPKRPEGHHSITPGFTVPQAKKVLEFVQQAFGGKLVDRYDGPNGTIGHAEVMIGDSVVMFADPQPGFGPMPASLLYYVDEAAQVDALYRRALELGASSLREPADQFYGHRSATVQDVGGNKWTISAIVEDVSKEEMQRRFAKLMGGH